MPVITKLNSGVAEPMYGTSKIIIFDAITDYTTASLETLTGGKDVGSIEEKTVKNTGDDVSKEMLKDTNGKVIATVMTNGTFGYDFNLVSTDVSTMQLLFGADVITVGADVSTNWILPTSVLGYGTKVATIQRPIAKISKEGDKCVFYPKAQICASRIDGGAESDVIKVSVTAEEVDQAKLKTVMDLKIGSLRTA